MSDPTHDTRLGRLLYGIFGRERVDRWFPDPDAPRCEWRSPLAQLQCARDAGHSGVCVTQHERTNTQTGKTFTTRREWYGINYESEPS